MIIEFSTLIKNNNNYDAYRQYLLSIYSFSNEYNILSSLYTSTQNLAPSFVRLWCNFSNYETGVLISYFIFIIIIIAFEVLSFLHHNKKLHIFDIKSGISSKIILLINIIFYVLFMIYSPLLLYLFIYSILVMALSPLQFKNVMDTQEINNPYEESWNKIETKITPIINCVIVLIIFILNLLLTDIKYSIIRYINKDYDDDNSNENSSNEINNNNQNYSNSENKIMNNENVFGKENNNNINCIKFENNNTKINCSEDNKINNKNINNENNNINDENNNIYNENNNVKDDKNENVLDNIKLSILDKDYNAHIKMNEGLFLKELCSDNIYKFLKIKIDTISNEYIYLKLGINCITDQVSIGEWDYPMINDTFIQVSSLCKQIYALLFLSIPLFQFHVQDETDYIKNISNLSNLNMIRFNNPLYIEKKPEFYSIFAYYGIYEKGLNISRFVIYTINIVILLLFMLYRIYFGGFKKPKLYIASLIVSICFIFQNISMNILNFLLLIFTGLSISSYYNGFAYLKDDMIQAKLIIQSIFIVPIFAINMSILICSIKLGLHLKDIIKDLNENIKENMKNQEKPQKEIKYISLNGNICTLKEIIDQRLQRNIYYRQNMNNQPIEENRVLYENNPNEIIKIKTRTVHLENNENNSKDIINK